jgi:hypothetical protein
MDNQRCYCRNPNCALYEQAAPEARLKFRDWHWGGARFQYLACSQRV